ncbi:MAG: 30S ribosome-binding factor RbfA [Chlorobi bacterium]|nr:30S ribosome-binding factor RbfA [Chlorobiota bacterium]
MSIRTERVGALLRQTLATHFQGKLPDYLDGMVTITAVRVSADLAIAKVYISIFNSKTDPGILVKRLNAHQKEIRTALARDVRLRKMPEFRFFLDDTLDTAKHIDKLIEKVRAEDEEQRAARGETGEFDKEIRSNGD